MVRATRSFKLTLSSAGIDMLIESHCHLIRATRALIAWGTTLHVAIEHLATLPEPTILAILRHLDVPRYSGKHEHHVGAPHRLKSVAMAIVERVKVAAPGQCAPTLGAIYIIALHELAKADYPALLEAFGRVQSSD